MKILWIPQLSVKDANSKFLLTADSNWRFACDLIEGIKAIDSEIKIDLLIPSNITNTEHIKEINVDLVIFNVIAENVFGTRFHFDDNFMRDLLQKNNYDFIWNNEPCHTMNLRIASINCEKEPVILTYNHWIDFSGSKKLPKYTYNIRQVEGALFSDICASNSEFSLNMWLYKASQDYFNEKSTIDLALKALKCPPPYNDIFFEKFKCCEKNQVFTIAYNQRFSTLQYYKYSWEKSLEIVEKVINDGYKIKVMVFNPVDKDINNIISKYNFLEVVSPKNRDDYLYNLSKCHLTFDYYRDERIWSIAMIDACAVRCLPLLQNFTGYSEMYDKNNNQYFNYQDEKQLIQLIKYYYDFSISLNNSIDNAIKHMKQNYSSKVVAQQVLDKIKNI